MAELTQHERAALNAITNLTEPSRLRELIKNARQKKSHTVERAAFLRLCEIQPEANPGTVEYDVWKSIHALEEMLRDERGKTILLSRTRQKISKDGEAKTASDLTMKRGASQGFDDLIDRGHPELTFEAVVLRHPKTFDAEVINAARVRLEGAGVDLHEILSTEEQES